MCRDRRMCAHRGRPVRFVRSFGRDGGSARGRPGVAAREGGASDPQIILRHLLPGCYNHILAIATLAIPGTILGETALSFLGLGVRPPMTSWGVLLEEAQHLRVLTQYPWLVLPVVPILVAVMAFNFVGDALRDAADPYGN